MKKNIKFLVYSRGGGIINFKKKSDAQKYAKMARKKGLKGVGVSQTTGASFLDNTIVIPKLKKYPRAKFKELKRRKK